MTRALLAVARALLAIARAVSGTPYLALSEHGLVVLHEGRLYFRRHEWLADRWAPIAWPSESLDATARRSVGVTTDRNKARRARTSRSR